MRRSYQNAELSLLLEVAGTPKPGNVDRHRDLQSLRFEHFLAGAVGATPGLRMAEDGAAVGPAFERAIEGMATQSGGNTQFGAVLLLVPLIRASRTDLSQPVAESVVEETTVADASAFYRAFDDVEVAVGPPPTDRADLDVRRGSSAIQAIENARLTLYDVMELSVPGDDVAREWTTGFDRSFGAAAEIASANGSVLDRCAAAFLSLLADRPDTLVATKHGNSTAARISERARSLVEADALDTNPTSVETFADDLVEAGINPGTTADITAAGLFISLERSGIEV